ncbi:MAG: ABC transporter ATP-binding protein [Anaerolineales bacterium]|nr:ABC transporter ATP-binding protein [Anaerolineales bacterium]
MKKNGNARPNGKLIELVDVTKAYHTPAGTFTALNGVTLSIDSGEFVSIVGKSGSGKTTLINLVTGIDDPSSGEVYVGGTPVHTLKEGEKASWRGATVGVVFQFFQLLPTLTVLENVMLPMDLSNRFPISEHADRAMALLELVELKENAHQLPGLLSGGLQQRAAIARALANDPPIIATDEPTGNLDSRSAEAVMRLFENLVQQRKTVLMVTHDPDLAQRAVRIIEIADGKIVNGD